MTERRFAIAPLPSELTTPLQRPVLQPVPQLALATTLPETQNPKGETQYSTAWGILSFHELYLKTRRIVAAKLRHHDGDILNNDDLADALQVGYLKLWQSLQKKPAQFADKPRAYLLKSLFFHSKTQRYAHLRHYRKVSYNADANRLVRQAFPDKQQVETWIDLQRALGEVVTYISKLDNPVYLWAFYNIITQVKTADIARIYGRGLTTITKAKQPVRGLLTAALPHYGEAQYQEARQKLPAKSLPISLPLRMIATAFFQ